jgi:hypothetical protein
VPTTVSSGRPRTGAIITTAVIAVAALVIVGYFVFNRAQTPLAGPLDAGVDRQLTLPLRAGDKGAAWGDLILTNKSSESSITLDSVAFDSTTGTLNQTTSPYVWDENRYKVAGSGSLQAYQLPLPTQWARVPTHPFQGYVLKPASATTGDDEPEAEVVFEFGVPEKASGFRAVTVGYHIGAVAYRKTFDIGFVLCPPNDQAPCK